MVLFASRKDVDSLCDILWLILSTAPSATRARIPSGSTSVLTESASIDPYCSALPCSLVLARVRGGGVACAACVDFTAAHFFTAARGGIGKEVRRCSLYLSKKKEVGEAGSTVILHFSRACFPRRAHNPRTPRGFVPTSTLTSRKLAAEC